MIAGLGVGPPYITLASPLLRPAHVLYDLSGLNRLTCPDTLFIFPGLSHSIWTHNIICVDLFLAFLIR